MATYVLAFRGPQERTVDAEAEAEWGRWFREIGGSIVDQGHRVGEVKALGSAGAGNGHGVLSGYIAVAAEDLDGAVAIARGCPGLRHGGGVEVAERIDM